MLQDLIKDMNAKGNEEPPVAPPTEPVNQPVNQPIDTPAATIPVAEPPKDTPVEPVVATPAATPDLEIPDEKFYGRLSKLTEGSINTEEEFAGLVSHYNELLEQAEQGFQPKFKDERTKMVYQILAENEGREPEAAMRTLRALNFNPEGKSAKEVLFEAYLLNPINSDLGPIEAQKYFEAEYDEKYHDVDGNPIKERQQALAVREGVEAINKIKNGLKASEAPANEISEKVVSAISSAVDKFGGLRLAFTDNPQESDYLSMAVAPEELQGLKEDALHPQEWWADFLSKFETDKGFDHPAFIREFYEMKNHQKKAQLAFQHGKKLGELAKINEARNASDLKRIDQAQPAGPGKQSIYEAWAGAQKG